MLTHLAVAWLPERAGGAPGRRVRGRGLDLPPDVGDGVEDVDVVGRAVGLAAEE